MSDIPLVWWLPGEGLLAVQRGTDLMMPTGGWQAVPDPVRRPLLDKGFPLVTQASRDELRDVLRARAALFPVEVEAVLDVLTERGLVASPETGEGQ